MRTGATAVVGIALLLSAAGGDAQEVPKLIGAVEDARSGNVIGGAQVRYDVIGMKPQLAWTDGQGRFELPGGGPGIVTVSAQKYSVSKRSWPPRDRGSSLLFELNVAATVSGSVVDASTQQGLAATVMAIVRGKHHDVSMVEMVSGGSYQFDDAPAGPASIIAYADGYAPAYGEVMVKAGVDTVKRFALLLESGASGSVVTADDSPVSGATVYIGYSSSLSGAGTLEQFVTGHVVTDDEGGFMIRGLVPDTAVALQAELDGRLSDIVTVSSITPGMEQTGIVLRMQ